VFVSLPVWLLGTVLDRFIVGTLSGPFEVVAEELSMAGFLGIGGAAVFLGASGVLPLFPVLSVVGTLLLDRGVRLPCS
jgi:hypothetical protein